MVPDVGVDLGSEANAAQATVGDDIWQHPENASAYAASGTVVENLNELDITEAKPDDAQGCKSAFEPWF